MKGLFGSLGKEAAEGGWLWLFFCFYEGSHTNLYLKEKKKFKMKINQNKISPLPSIDYRPIDYIPAVNMDDVRLYCYWCNGTYIYILA